MIKINTRASVNDSQVHNGITYSLRLSCVTMGATTTNKKDMYGLNLCFVPVVEMNS